MGRVAASTSTERSELAEDVDEVLSALERRRGRGWKSIFVCLFGEWFG